MKFWNIGAEGQVLAGGLATASCMIFLGEKLPTPLLILVMLISSILAGALWGLVPAYFKTRFNSRRIQAELNGSEWCAPRCHRHYQRRHLPCCRGYQAAKGLQDAGQEPVSCRHLLS
ncbi:MAG: ABC transporter permease [Clostridia bacterium]|nr:ABC transporter permease [Clostridia bacterium]